MKKKVLIIEFYRSHFELLYSHQVIWQEAGYEVHFFLNERLKQKTPELVPAKCTYFSDKTYFYFLELLHLIINQGFDIVVCNTAHGIRTRNFVVLAKLIPTLRVLGICHYADTLQKSTTQKIISWGTDKYWVLSEMFFENGLLKDRNKIDVLYPVFRFNKPIKNLVPSGVLQIAVIGEISPDKKDFITLCKALMTHKTLLSNKVVFVCLGNSDTDYGRHIKQEIARQALQDFFVFYNRFIPDAELLQVLANCDMIATLIHPTVQPVFKEYLHSNISGSYNLAYWGSIPLLLDSSFAPFSDFKEISYFYAPDELGEALLQICQNRDILLALQNGFERHQSKLTPSFQATRLMRFLGLAE